MTAVVGRSRRGAPDAGPAAVRLRRAGPDDVPAICALPGLGASTRAQVAADLARDDRRCLVAIAGGEVVGFVAGLRQLEDVHVLDLAVQPALRRRGIGERLLTVLIAQERAAGATGVTLEVRPSNAPAIALYRRLGFVVEGRRPRYYPDGEDALLLWRRFRTDGTSPRDPAEKD